MTSIPEISARGSHILWAKFQIPVDPGLCVGPRSGRKGEKCRPLDHTRHTPFINQLCSLTIMLGSVSIYIGNCSSYLFHVVFTLCLAVLYICYLRMRSSKSTFKVQRLFEVILVRDTARRGHWDFRFCGLCHFLDRFFGFSVFIRKNFDFSVLTPVAVFTSILLSVSGFRQKWNRAFGFAIRCSLVVFRSLVGKFAPKRRQPHVRVFGFCSRFSVLIEIYFGFAVVCILCSVLPFLIHPSAPQNEARVLPRPRERYTMPCYLCESQAVKHNEFSANKVRINYIKYFNYGLDSTEKA